MAENPLAFIAEADPRFGEHLKAADGLIFGEGVIPKRYRLLIALAFDAAHGAGNGVRSLAQRAMREGATRDEILEAIRVAYHLSGVGSVYTASQALREILS
jgi:alkylhydroperoxidase/carboxymuconolactone decarboxylase family protein YurZ